MSVLKTFRKAVVDRRRLHLDYSRWLEDSETLTVLTPTITPVTVPPLAIDEQYFDTPAKQAVIFATGGLLNTTYNIELVATTSEGQIKRDDIALKVKP